MAGAEFPALAALGGPIFVATGLFMAATAIALASWLLTRTLPIMPLVSGVVVFIFGGLTLCLQDDVFIKMKPTIINTLFGGVLLGGLLLRQVAARLCLRFGLQLDAEGWRKLTLRWGLFFLFLAVVNEVVWRNFSTDTWVTFKVWGIMPITMVFTFSQMPLIMRHSLEEQPQSEIGRGNMDFVTTREELRAHYKTPHDRRLDPQGTAGRSTAIAAPSSARARSC